MPDLVPDELKAIFGDELSNFLNKWDSDTLPPGTDSLRSNPEHTGITDEQIQSYVTSRMNGIGPRPLNSSQQPRPPQFLPGNSGHAPAGGIESDGSISNPTTPPLDSLTSEQENFRSSEDEVQGGVEGQDTAAATPEDIPEESSTQLPSDITPERIEAFQRFDERLRSDPRLQQILIEYASTGRIPPELAGNPAQVPGEPTVTHPPVGSPATPPPFTQPATQPATQPSEPLFQLPQDIDLDDPTVQAIVPLLQAQQQQISQLTNLVQQSVQTQQFQSQQQQVALVNRAVESFKQQKQLSDDEITRVRTVAGQIPIVDQFLRTGIDPRSGLPTKPDPLTALETALDIAYWAMPDMRQREMQRVEAQRRGDAERKRKAGSLSGNSGSIPRQTTQPRPGTPESRQAMLSDLSAMMNGTYSE